MSEMVVVYAGGAGPRAFSLWVDRRSVGADDFLGIEEGHAPEDPESILGQMVRFGADTEGLQGSFLPQRPADS